MKGICNPDDFQKSIDLACVDPVPGLSSQYLCLQGVRTLPSLLPKREAELTKAIGSWGFSGHDLSEFELVHAACLMLQHVLKIPELDKWRLSTGELPVLPVECTLT